ncbi:MAG: Holliday junction branch migration protein RuvA [Oscillospiraceae bacterium]|nr:Holliday junction branch migration protein RuvA [Oscillospiraceae bacterium]
MLYSLRGTLILKTADTAVIECNGVGFACRTTLSTLSSLPKKGAEAMVYTYMKVGQDNSIELFGFATEQELSCFKMLTTVTGVGPKAGLSILSDTTPERFALHVASSDFKAFTKTKGIGAKLAQRIVLELKDKITKEQLSDASLAGFTPALADTPGNSLSEAVAALVVLGYSQSEAVSAVSALDASMAVEEMIKRALKSMIKS